MAHGNDWSPLRRVESYLTVRAQVLEKRLPAGGVGPEPEPPDQAQLWRDYVAVAEVLTKIRQQLYYEPAARPARGGVARGGLR